MHVDMEYGSGYGFPWIKHGLGPNYVSASLLTIVNLLAHMDLFTVSAVAEKIQKDLKFENEEWKVGFLQTVNYISMGVSSPLWGVLGDKISRKCIIIFALIFWSLTVLISSLAPSYEMLATFQALVGVGYAGFAINAPSVIKDLFDNPETEKDESHRYLFGKSETKMKAVVSLWLAIYTYPKPIGVGLGFVWASSIDKSSGWRWAIRSTIFISWSLAIILLVF